MYLRFPPRSGLFLRRWSLFSSIFGAGFITFGIRTLKSRVSLLQIGHRGIFTISFFLRRFRSWNIYHTNKKSWGTSCENFRSWFKIVLEIWSVEVRSFFKLLNRSSWNLHYNFFSTNFQKLKFLGCEAETPRKLFKKFQSLVRNIFGDMICGI